MKLNSPLLPYPMSNSSVMAFSTTRHGGCGSGAYGTFNCTPYTGDDPRVVHSNLQHLAQLLDMAPDRIVIPYQTHSCNILTLDNTFVQLDTENRHTMLQAKDALITDCMDVCLCISTADCIPLLLYDHTHRAIAAIHAGWRGTVAGIVSLTMQAMHTTYGTRGTDVQAIIGPGISLDAFEVGNEVYTTFEERGFDMQQIAHWHADKGKYHLDLPKANRLQLIREGVPEEQIDDCHICTYTHHHDLFSARRMGIHSGRILNGIVMKQNLSPHIYA